jgi:hypothetical protein
MAVNKKINAMMMQAKRRKRPAEKRRLTEFAVKKAKPKAEAYLIWDTHQRGLALRVQPTGAKSWNTSPGVRTPPPRRRPNAALAPSPISPPSMSISMRRRIISRGRRQTHWCTVTPYPAGANCRHRASRGAILRR